MKKVALYLVCTFMLCLSIVDTSYSQEIEILRNGNLRSGPSIQHEIIGKVTSGMKVIQLENKDDWYNVKLPDQKTGWVNKILITKEELKNVEGNLIPWRKLVDKYDVKGRNLGNKVVFESAKDHPGMGSGYYIKSEDDSSLEMVLGVDSPIATESGTLRVKMFAGPLTDGAPDLQFYSILGIGSTVVLPNQWIKIFGFEIKGGKMYIQKSGIRFSQSEIRK